VRDVERDRRRGRAGLLAQRRGRGVEVREQAERQRHARQRRPADRGEHHPRQRRHAQALGAQASEAEREHEAERAGRERQLHRRVHAADEEHGRPAEPVQRELEPAHA